MSNFIKKFKNYIKENYDIKNENHFNIGDLVWAKHMGSKGLIGLVVSEPKDDEGELVQDIYLRGYNGEIHPIEIQDLKNIIKSGHCYNAHLNGDITAYTNIASKMGIELNPIYQEYVDSTFE